ncbi:hypothetical protein PR202_gb11740 [Eleusine coracana subsp. coracana]|uniref:Uncharacterized protein n=1 Tax=Eleusine coracana subsp. coracana TaxID=191504 RepID=A0AAV5EPM5_ELECO|nr:hypothetical protein PR202_gb11738 [Eleusine coracana subsp. coracana]GJN24033.1 hypothetical protein PR202_gb11740 [Eleusine coracana subsp. coracana]
MLLNKKLWKFSRCLCIGYFIDDSCIMSADIGNSLCFYERLRGQTLFYQYCDSVNGGFMSCYNALERRASSKGGKETNRRTYVPSPAATKPARHKAQASSHKTKLANGHVASTPQRSAKTSTPANSVGPAYVEHVTAICALLYASEDDPRTQEAEVQMMESQQQQQQQALSPILEASEVRPRLEAANKRKFEMAAS